MSDQAKTKTKQVWSGRMDPDLLEKARSVAYWTPGLTFSHLVETALRTYLEGWEREHGTPGPPEGPLREGRPLIQRRLQ